MTDANKYINAVADKVHDVWARWTIYQFSLCEKDKDGNLIIPKEKVERWKRQAQTIYDELPEEEKLSDVLIAAEYITLMGNLD